MQQDLKPELKWIKDRKDYLIIRRIERELDMPEGTLKKWVDGKRGLADQWHGPVIAWVKKFKK